MTEEERQQAFAKALEALQKQYGFSIGVQMVPETLGPVVQVRAQLVLVPDPKWEPSKEGKRA